MSEVMLEDRDVSFATEEGNYEDEGDIKIDDDPSIAKTGVFSGFLNLSNTVIGSGVLGLPAAFMGVGYVLGTIMLIICSIMAGFTLHLLSLCAHKVGGRKHSFGSVGYVCLPWLSWVVDAIVIFNCFGAAVSYLIIFGDNLPMFIQHVSGMEDTSSFWIRREVWISFAFILIGIPLTCAPKLDFLKYTSFLALCSVVYCMILTILYWAEPSDKWDPCKGRPDDCTGAAVAFNNNFIEIFKALPIFLFAFTCHYNIFGIYNELKDQTVATMNKIITSALSFVALMYVVFALGGYLTYGDETKSNILINFPLNTVSSIARVAISLVVGVSYPLMTHPTRLALMHIYERLFDMYSESENKREKMYYWIFTVVILGVTYTVAMTVTDLGFVFGLIGATASSFIAFILPGAFYMLQERHTPKHTVLMKFYYYSSWFFIGFGIIFSVIGTTVMFL